MAGRPTGNPVGPSGLVDSRRLRAASIWVPSLPSQAEAPSPHTLISERMICLGTTIVSFHDPLWGEIAFNMSVWRRFDGNLPEYEVVVE